MRTIEPAIALRGDLRVPGDKSISHRALLLGALADGVSEIRGLGRSADTMSTAAAVQALGAEVELDLDDDVIRVHGVGLRGLTPPAGPVDCGNAGTLMRLIAGILVGQQGRFELIGDASLSGRPQERIAGPLREMGASIETVDGHAPVTIVGGPLHAIRYELPVASAQVKSAVLLAGLFVGEGPTTVVEPEATRDHTERMLRAAGVRVDRVGKAISVWPPERLAPFSIDVPGDFSSAAPFLLAAALVPGSELRVHGVDVNPTRIGFLHVLERMGARISVYNRRSVGGEPVADIEVASSELVATQIEPVEVPLMVDELPLFAVAAACARGNSVVTGAAELRAKETDRIETLTTALRALGVRIVEFPDGFRVHGVPARLRGGVVRSAGDHRIAMLGAIAGLISKDGVRIDDAEAVAVSFPAFFDLLDSVSLR
jgi:3-phosphoshikimate 1-carboxyvinyltransferase